MAILGAEFFDSRDSERQSVQISRLVFLSQIERQAPAVVRSLRADVLPHFRAWAGGRDAPEVLTALSWWKNGAEQALPATPELAALRSSLEAWATRWSLTDDWLLADARHTLSIWQQYPTTSSATPLRFHADGWGGAVHELGIEHCHPFEPTRETWRDFTTRVGQWTRRNRDAAAALMQAHGLEWSGARRARSGPDPFRPFAWLARYQCRREGYATISTNVDPSNVRKAVKQAAQEIGLTLRPAAKGRPKK